VTHYNQYNHFGGFKRVVALLVRECLDNPAYKHLNKNNTTLKTLTNNMQRYLAETTTGSPSVRARQYVNSDGSDATEILLTRLDEVYKQHGGISYTVATNPNDLADLGGYETDGDSVVGDLCQKGGEQQDGILGRAI
jgi:hypothetical protein